MSRSPSVPLPPSHGDGRSSPPSVVVWKRGLSHGDGRSSPPSVVVWKRGVKLPPPPVVMWNDKQWSSPSYTPPWSRRIPKDDVIGTQAGGAAGKGGEKEEECGRERGATKQLNADPHHSLLAARTPKRHAYMEV